MQFDPAHPADIALGRTVTARSVWADEDRFNVWLASPDPLARISRIVGGDLELLDRETNSVIGRCDLLCANQADGSIAVIESQFGGSDQDHLGRLLAYAAEHDAAAAVLVAERVTGEIAWLCDELSKSEAAQFRVHAVHLQILSDDDSQTIAAMAPASAAARAQPARVRSLPEGLGEPELLDLLERSAGSERLAVDRIADARLLPAAGPVLLGRIAGAMQPAELVELLIAAVHVQPAAIVLATGRLDASTRRLLELLDQLTGRRCRVALLRTDASGRRSCKPLAEHGSASQMAARRLFWERLASVMSKRTVTRMRKTRALGLHSRGLVYGMGRSGVRLAVLYHTRRRRFSLELRIHNANPAVAINWYEQLQLHSDALQAALGERFRLEWLGQRLRARQFVLRLDWLGGRDEPEPFASEQLLAMLAEDALAAEARLAPIVVAIEDYSW